MRDPIVRLAVCAVAFYAALCWLTGCGPADFTEVQSLEYRGLSIRSELQIDTFRVHADIDRIADTLTSQGLLKGDFATEFSGMPVLVRDVIRLETNAAGTYYRHGTTTWIEVNRGGGSLGHELMHALGFMHDKAVVWEDSRCEVAEIVFKHENGGWQLPK